MNFHYRLTFTRYIWCFLSNIVAWPCDLDLWPLTFWLDSVTYIGPLMPDPHTNIDYPTIIGYWVMNYCIWSHFRYREQSLRIRRVTLPITGGESKNSPHFWNPLPNLPIHFVTFRALRRRFSHVITEKLHCEKYKEKVNCVCAVSLDLCMGVPQNQRNNFDPELSIHYTTFMGLRWQLRVIYMGAPPC